MTHRYNERRKRNFLCPVCKKLGVYVKFAGIEDCFVCRYCGFNCYSSGNSPIDLQRRAELRAYNRAGSEYYGNI